ncbi:hypothetical protein ES705_06555 [subsurface metagenome]
MIILKLGTALKSEMHGQQDFFCFPVDTENRIIIINSMNIETWVLWKESRMINLGQINTLEDFFRVKDNKKYGLDKWAEHHKVDVK